MFSRAWQLVHVFLRLATNTCFPNSHTAYKGYLAARATYNSPQTFSWYKSFFSRAIFLAFWNGCEIQMFWIWWVKFPAGISQTLFSVLFFFSLCLRAPCNQSCYTLVSLVFVQLFFSVFFFDSPCISCLNNSHLVFWFQWRFSPNLAHIRGWRCKFTLKSNPTSRNFSSSQWSLGVDGRYCKWLP